MIHEVMVFTIGWLPRFFTGASPIVCASFLLGILGGIGISPLSVQNSQNPRFLGVMLHHRCQLCLESLLSRSSWPNLWRFSVLLLSAQFRRQKVRSQSEEHGQENQDKGLTVIPAQVTSTLFLYLLSSPHFLIYLFRLCQVLVAACGLLSCGTHAGCSSPTRDRTQVPCIGSVESCTLDHQGSPLDPIF